MSHHVLVKCTEPVIWPLILDTSSFMWLHSLKFLRKEPTYFPWKCRRWLWTRRIRTKATTITTTKTKMMTSKTMTIITMIMNKAEDFVDGWRTTDNRRRKTNDDNTKTTTLTTKMQHSQHTLEWRTEAKCGNYSSPLYNSGIPCCGLLRLIYTGYFCRDNSMQFLSL